ncbi:aspartate 1-decarboxylase [Virgibacillus halodenitrificans]|uniref:Aspartate 1-decarboxylase n=1 Tax=Virgibacillus halodenitrificans TaxID=1482 RepID=A0ABR7VKZ6_VIRHA|nr:aspartate 1-decarboxylase [Virgibacillus halodenitrificans]MBD1222586.1 aspartate 1-decarboxylase [Virgibacillus halodenitrificans]MCJ0931031.1 aspartate 1-decarboxylase [Virgibacillus halodenitrificans]MEC2160418.1 aspartate 1-decarboxylase [Virgibacillus halodenitrificans]WHX27332.1 aspartate 1-decarboxylase [Virgibacillus halodenitrificans]CDQ35665.1 Aspartate 1-decarboxylase precursor [Virgibacillus halodenitrificans]
MIRTLMKGKIHRARVTEANLNYVGSVTIDQDILELVNILPHEKVQIVNNNNGARLETYVIPGERGSGVVCLNGAAARLVQKGDIVIIVSYGMFFPEELATFRPKVAIMNERNQVEQLLEQEPPLTEVTS